MIRKFYVKHKETFDKFDGLLINNTVLERGLILSPIIVAANTIENALMLGVVFMLLTFFTVLISSFIPKNIPYTFRVIIYTFISVIVYFPIAYFANTYFADVMYKVGIFLPLMITNALIVTKSETRFIKLGKKHMIIDLLSHTIGAFIVILIVGIVRETIGNATYFNESIDSPFTFSVLMLPFGGFVIVGLLSALMQKVRMYLTDTDEDITKIYKKEEKNTTVQD